MHGRPPSILAALGVAALLAGPVAVDAASPTPGKRYAGATSQERPLKFGVSKSGRRITKLEIGGAGPPPSGVILRCSERANDHIDSRFRASDSVRIQEDGSFSARFKTKGSITEGELRFKGRFSSRRKGRGTINWSVKRTDDGRTCRSGELRFTARRQ